MAITLDQSLGSNNAASIGNSGTLVITTGAAATAASRIVVWVSVFKGTGGYTFSVSDSAGSYVRDLLVTNGSDFFAIYSRVLVGSLASNSSITLTNTDGANATGGALIGACSYLGTTGVDTTRSNTGTSAAAWSTGSSTNSVADALFVGGAGADGTITSESSTPTSGTERFDQFNATANQGAVFQDLIASTIASTALTGTWGTTTGLTVQTMALVIYKGTAAAAPAIPPTTYARVVLSRGVRKLSEITRFRDRVPVSFVISGSTFSDSMTGSILISGSRTESRVGSNTRTGSILISGSRTESRVGSNSTTGSIQISGSRTESRVGSNAITGSILISGTKNETRTGANSRTGSIQISGSRSESRVMSNTRTGTVQINGSGSAPPPSVGTAHQDFAIRLHGRIVHESSPLD